MASDAMGEPDGEFDRITDVETVKPLLAALPERVRSILYLRFFAVLTQSQIAAEIGASKMQVSRILERTLRDLRDQL